MILYLYKLIERLLCFDMKLDQKSQRIRNIMPKTLLKTFFYIASFWVFLSTLMSLSSSFNWFFALFSHFHPQIFLASLILAVVYFIKGRTELAGIFCVCAFIHGWILASSVELKPWSSPYVQKKDTVPIRVLALNLHQDESTLRPTAKIIEEEKPTLILLTELPKNHKTFLSSLKEAYPYVSAQAPVGPFDVFLLSRWPIKKSTVEHNSSFLPILKAEICTPEQPSRCFSLAGLHSPTPFFSGSTLQEHMFNRLAHVSQEHQHSPFIIMGDLNSTPWSPLFRSLLTRSEMHSSAVGRSWQTTWFSRNPLLGLHIDHILINKHVESRAWWVGPNVGSDHYPVLADLELRWP